MKKNFAISVILQEKDGKTGFTKAELPGIVNAARAEKVDAYVDNTKEEPMMLKEPNPGKIVSERALKQFDAKELTLSNGAKVILKKTNLKANEILMMATAAGGKSIGKNENLAMRNCGTILQAYMDLEQKTLTTLPISHKPKLQT